MKPGAKLLSHDGDVWTVVKLDHPTAGHITIEHHTGARFYVHKHMLKHHARRLRFWNKHKVRK